MEFFFACFVPVFVMERDLPVVRTPPPKSAVFKYLMTHQVIYAYSCIFIVLVLRFYA